MTETAWTAAAVVYGAASTAALLLYGLDKSAAAGGRRRVPEGTLHVAELLGGWPGALLASALFRHKNRKPSFRLVRAAIVLLHGAGWAWALGWIP